VTKLVGLATTRSAGSGDPDRFSREHAVTPQQAMNFSLAAGDDSPPHLGAASAAPSSYGVLTNALSRARSSKR